MEINKVNLEEKFDSFSEYWNPKIIAELNGQQVKLAKFNGEFVMHNHEHEDELFLLIEGSLSIELENRTLDLKAGEMVVIPKGTDHKPIAHGTAKVLLFEPAQTVNTGNLKNERTLKDLDRI